MNKPPQGYVSQAAHNELKRLLANAIAAKEQAERDRDAVQRENERLTAEVKTLREAAGKRNRVNTVLCDMVMEAVTREAEARVRGDNNGH